MAPRERVYDVVLSKDMTREEMILRKEKEFNLSEENKWMAKVDLDAFREEIKALGKKFNKGQGQRDVDHLNKFILWSNMATFGGIALMGVVPFYFLIPAIMLGIGTTTRWTMIAHHTCHGGYDNCEKSGRFNRFRFAVGSFWRRFCDWFDWMAPEAWNVEHNNLHHYHLSEEGDPDLVERNMATIRDAPLPIFFKYLMVGFLMCTWKWSYYAPNTYKELRIKEFRKTNPKELEKYMNEPKWDLHGPFLIYTFFTPGALPPFLTGLGLLGRVLGPYFIYRFGVLPLIWIPIGHMFNAEDPIAWYINAVLTLFLSDVMGNLHSFLIVAPNHAGLDLYKFSSHCKPKSGMFFLRQVISSANFTAGTDLIDFFHGFLNYQVEHHMWPDLSMKSYQNAMPLVKEICKHHHIPYIQESVFTRLVKTVDIMVGKTEMRDFPEGVITETK